MTARRISIERAKLITESDKETAAQPIHIRRAMALEKVPAGMPIFVSGRAARPEVWPLPPHPIGGQTTQDVTGPITLAALTA